ncbi:MAG: hypothetical protein A3G02_00335 [Candidatus Yanofskybacteria bacterium RIFCSPLOWO2_12_FULL_44_13b]|uniref:Uncharacterized protein n=2 Tax=Candidatus Yanofskyibacteriota TaxID=1752733 RepID=A0A1F8H2V9_9BACT|nr:MAG: hypothetical protein A3C01_02005 [Candidatus Yanofskybacteria bacterium RIFCSPHIGHO2_02_FULL_44_36b]OGN31298.1 MAG: hypothetical protein A3I96_00620 [Candidatus Yanofskybacteria bacterium RIFCSPLOWO2_02_FULL_44_18]OGN35044.1 MAG: hypothetical protein A3G02_00335 [Candidatus Yanofskybacteria bacterium RIFCSPLOWO2_12_FULL_44_13b]
MNQKIKNKILFLARRDHQMRASNKWDESIDKKNIKELKKIVYKVGWPDKKLVGVKAALGAWLIVQHGVFNIEFQKYCLGLLKKAVADKKMPQFTVPFLIDRIKMVEGKPQLFGTQFFKKTRSGKLHLWKIYNKKGIDKRRKKCGLEPLKNHKMVDQRIRYKYY